MLWSRGRVGAWLLRAVDAWLWRWGWRSPDRPGARRGAQRAMSNTRRQDIAEATKREVLTEAGYRCAIPRCRTTLAIDLHHLVRVTDGGGNEAANLLALCPNCHALHHRGIIHAESIQVWKGLLVSLNEGIGRDAKDLLLLLSPENRHGRPHWFSSDGVLRYAGLIVAGLVTVAPPMPQRPEDILGTLYAVNLSEKGAAVVAAWERGDRAALEAAQRLGAPPIQGA